MKHTASVGSNACRVSSDPPRGVRVVASFGASRSLQVVPHEVMGMSSYSKNILIGLGGKEAIDYSHFIGAAYGLEKMMGRVDNPLRRILNRAAEEFLEKIPLVGVTANDA